MKRFLFSIFFVITSLSITAQTLNLSDLEGKWFINQSNFPMWLKGNKTHPTFNYTLTTKHGKQVLLDEVLYTKKSKTKGIVGYDKVIDEDNNSFVWRGKGLLAFVKSKWSILYFDSEKQWMIIHFEKTLFTPEGYDLVSKYKTIDSKLEKEIQKKWIELGVNPTLRTIAQE